MKQVLSSDTDRESTLTTKPRAEATISIAMATYNGQKFLGEQLDTLARQTRLPLELVVTDDGSSDATLEIVAEFSRNAPFPVRVYRNPSQLGYGNNFLYCAGLCVGDYVAFCDQDDIWDVTKLEIVTQALAITPDASLIVHQGLVVDTANVPTGAYYPRVGHAEVKPRFTSQLWLNVPGFAMIFDARLVREVPHEVRPTDPITGTGPMAHDQWIYLLAGTTGPLVFLTDNLVRYRRHAANTTPNAPPRRSSALLMGLRQSLAAGADHYRRMQEVMGEYQLFFFSLAEGSTTFATQFRDAGGRFAHRGRFFTMRAALYSIEAGMFHRIRSFRRLLQSGCYSASIFGRKALLKDLWVVFAGVGKSGA